MLDLLVFVVGCLCAAIGGELFVHGLVGIANLGRIPKGVVAATIGAFATSSPELIVGITSALDGVPEISFGDVAGSSIVNIALILAIPTLMFGLKVTRESTVRDLPFALGIFPILGIAAVDGQISHEDALLLFLVFVVWLGLVLLWALRNRIAEAPEGVGSRLFIYATAIVGLLTLFLAGQLIVTGATGMASAAGLPAFFVGATIVALGTSVPELATVLVASLRGHQEVGVQTILGSNVFNCLFIVPVAALIHPIGVGGDALWLTLGVGFFVTMLTVPVLSFQLGRWRGWALLTIYALFIAASTIAVSTPGQH
jgi:cation:H+ antiporter